MYRKQKEKWEDYKKRRKLAKEMEKETLKGKLIHCSSAIIKQKRTIKDFFGRVIKDIFGKDKTEEVLTKISVKGTYYKYKPGGRKEKQAARRIRANLLKTWEKLPSEIKAEIKGKQIPSFEKKYEHLKRIRMI